MMLEASVTGSIVGGLFRLAPELLRYVDRHLDRRHELAMQDVALQFERLRPDGAKYAELAMTGAETQVTLDALKDAWRQQFETGDKKLDRVSILVRPSVTYALVVLYLVVKVVMLVHATMGSFPISQAYSEDDLAFLSGITTFWFLGRPIEKRQA